MVSQNKKAQKPRQGNVNTHPQTTIPSRFVQLTIDTKRAKSRCCLSGAYNQPRPC